MRTYVLAALAALGLAGLPTASGVAKAPSAPLYRLARTVDLGLPDRWDYLTFDPASDRLFIAHYDRLTVIDARSGRIVGTVAGIPGGTHGIGIIPGLGKGYTDDGKAGLAWAFDLKTYRKTAAIKAQPDADGIGVDRASGHVFVIDGDSGKLTVIDPHTNAVVATIDGGGGLEFGAPDGRGHFYVNGAEKNEVLRIDTATNRVDATWHPADCTSPHGLAVDPRSRRVFASCENHRLVVLDADTGALVAALPIGTFSDAVAFDPVRHRIFSSNFDGTLNVFAEDGPNRYRTLGTVQTRMSARTMAVDPRTGNLFLVAARMTVNPNAKPDDFRHRYTITPGTTQLLVYRPA